jgi:3-oxoacyl-(acyl-carrier-protein) synthase
MRVNHADMVLTVGGGMRLIIVFMYMCFKQNTGAFTRRSRAPFDHQSDGTALGEGIGIIVLETPRRCQNETAIKFML